MNRTLLVLDTGSGESAWNMALDEALLVTAAQREAVVLRFYGWTERSATFGYFQRLAEVETMTLLRPLIRRATGGGLVPHDRDWTYSLCVPPSHGWYCLTAVESYRSVHAWVVRAFQELGVAAELADCCRKEAPGRCFLGWEKFDVLWNGRKIGGAAQRRNRMGLLIQGSVQPPPPVESRRAEWQAAWGRTGPVDYFDECETCVPDPSLKQLAEDLATSRYRQPAYNAAR